MKKEEFEILETEETFVINRNVRSSKHTVRTYWPSFPPTMCENSSLDSYYINERLVVGPVS